MNLPNGTLLQGGKYKIVRFISSGGFGCTYEAVHTLLDKRIAIKESFVQSMCVRDTRNIDVQVTTPANVKSVQFLREKFLKEAKILSQFDHPNIVRVSDIFQENNTAYYVMDYIVGQSLAQIVSQQGSIQEKEALHYIRQVADALKYVHAHDYLHLDIKPGNIMVDNTGKAILIDFGASKHYDSESGENTTAFKSIRSEGYAPTEQTSGFVKFSPPTDIYALGATLYKLLTGERPPEAQLLMLREAKLKPLPRTISKSTKNAIACAMKPKRADRPQSVEEFILLLSNEGEVSSGAGSVTSNTKVNNDPSFKEYSNQDTIDVTLVNPSPKSNKKQSSVRKKASGSHPEILIVKSIPSDKIWEAKTILRGEFGLSERYADKAINNLPLEFSRNNYQQLITAGRYLKGIGAKVRLLDKSGNTVQIDAISFNHSRYKNVKEDNGKKSKTERIFEFITVVAGLAMIIIGFFFVGTSIYYAIFE